jgi:hypothetical protein
MVPEMRQRASFEEEAVDWCEPVARAVFSQHHEPRNRSEIAVHLRDDPVQYIVPDFRRGTTGHREDHKRTDQNGHDMGDSARHGLAVDHLLEFALAEDTLEAALDHTVAVYYENPWFSWQLEGLDSWHEMIYIGLETWFVEA